MQSDRLSAICAGLGMADEENGYIKDEYCLDNLKDLQRFLRRDDPLKRDVFKQICKWNIVSRDIIPIIEYYQNDRNLVISAVKILVFLTMPVDPSSNDIAQQIEYLWDLKSVMNRNVTVAVIVSLLEDPLDHLECNKFTEDDWKLVQLVLTLFRNVLAIRDITLHQKACGSATQYLLLADDYLELMFRENVMDIILVLTQHIDEPSGFIRHDNLLLLEIFHYVFLGRDPESVTESSYRKAEVDSLKSIMEEEACKRRQIGRKSLDRHSHFSGTFTRVLMDGSKTLCTGNPTRNNILKVHKVHRGPLKRIAWDHQIPTLQKENILELLRNFLGQFLSGGYNVLMQSIRNDIKNEHPSVQNTDIITFFQVVQFVLAFQYHRTSISKKADMAGPTEGTPLKQTQESENGFTGDICGPVAATLNEEMFKLVFAKWFETFEGLKQTNDYKSLSAAGSLMKYMIFMIDLVLKVCPEDSKETQTARVVLYKLFYDQTDQGLTQFLLNLFKSFDSHKQPRSDLADLLEIIHVVFRLMERLQSRGQLRVAKRARRTKKKKSSKITNEETNPKKNEEIHPNLRDSNNQTNNTTSDPTSQTDNTSNTNGPEPAVAGPTEPSSFNIEEESPGSSSDGSDVIPATSEVDFNVSRLVSGFVGPTVVHNIVWLLRHYWTNSVRTNHYIICMLRRVCEDLDMAPMLYQLSLLTTFHEVLADQRSSKSREHVNTVNFLTKLVRDMMKLFANQPLLFVEILFWKTRKDCHCITADALMSDIANLRRDINNNDNNNNLDNEEISTLNQRRGVFQKSIADSLGDDEADLVLPLYHENQREDFSSDEVNEGELHQTNQNTNKKKSLASLSESEAEHDKSGAKTAKRPRRSSLFSQEQEDMMKDLFKKHKEDRKCSRIIAEALDPDGKISPAQVSRKLRLLGLRSTDRTKITDLDANSPPASDEDDETLQAIMNRRKNVKSDEKDIDKTLGSLLMSKGKRSKSLVKRAKLKEMSEPESHDATPPLDTQDSVPEQWEKSLDEAGQVDGSDLFDDVIDFETDKTRNGGKDGDYHDMEILEDSGEEEPVVAIDQPRKAGSKRNLRLVFDEDEDD